MNIFQFGEELEGKLNSKAGFGFKERWSQNDVTTVHLPHDIRSQSRALAIDTKFYHLLKMIDGRHERKAYVGKIKDGYVAELLSADGKEVQLAIATKKKDTWEFKAGVMNELSVLQEYSDTRKGTLILLSLMQEILRDMEASQIRNDIQKYLYIAPTADDWEFGDTSANFSKLLCQFTNNVYYRITRSDQTSEPIKCNLDIKKIRQADIKKCEPSHIFGTPSVFQEKVFVKTKETFLYGKYLLNPSNKLSSLETKLIPEVADSYCTPLWVDTLCAQIQMSNDFGQPFRNILLTGPSGTGKTTGTKAMAAYLGLPYVKITCSPDTDIFDFIGQMIPNVSDDKTTSVEQLCSVLDIPTFDDIENNFEDSYLKLFGRPADKLASAADCYSEVFNRLFTNVKTGKDFTYVESDLVKAVKNGYFCEIQEPTVIKRSSVMVGLNSLLESAFCGASYTLPTGELIERHPDCVICLTTNSDYEGCNMIQQSVLSRMDIVRDVPNPSAEELAERTKALTGFSDEVLMLKMAETIKNINEFCHERDITDGICGPRELANWAKMALVIAKISNDLLSERIVCQAAFSTLINKVSQDKEDAEAVITGCLKVAFLSNDIEDARADYEEGRF